MRRWFAWAISIILAVTIGIYAGAKVTKASADAEIRAMEARMDEALKETAFWQGTLTRLANGEGGKIEGVEIKGKGE